MNDIRAILLAAGTSTRMKQQKMLLSYKGSIIIETKYKKDIENPDPEKGLKSLYQKFTNHILELECRFYGILWNIDATDDYAMEINLNQKR